MGARFKCRLKRSNGRFSNFEGVGPGIQSARHAMIRAGKKAAGGRVDLNGCDLAFWAQASPGRPWYRLPSPDKIKTARGVR